MATIGKDVQKGHVCPPECDTRIRHLEEAVRKLWEDQMDPKDGVNSQLFERARQNEGAINRIYGGLKLAAIMASIVATLMCGIVVYYLTNINSKLSAHAAVVNKDVASSETKVPPHYHTNP